MVLAGPNEDEHLARGSIRWQFFKQQQAPGMAAALPPSRLPQATHVASRCSQRHASAALADGLCGPSQERMPPEQVFN